MYRQTRRRVYYSIGFAQHILQTILTSIPIKMVNLYVDVHSNAPDVASKDWYDAIIRWVVQDSTVVDSQVEEHEHDNHAIDQQIVQRMLDVDPPNLMARMKLFPHDFKLY